MYRQKPTQLQHATPVAPGYVAATHLFGAPTSLRRTGSRGLDKWPNLSNSPLHGSTCIRTNMLYNPALYAINYILKTCTPRPMHASTSYRRTLGFVPASEQGPMQPNALPIQGTRGSPRGPIESPPTHLSCPISSSSARLCAYHILEPSRIVVF